jgi:multiple sugar transport system substrate-binding protein
MSSKQMTFARRATAATAAVIIGVTLAACSSSDSGSDAKPAGSAADLDAALQKGGTITYWSWTPSAEAQVAAFEKAYPKVDVKLVNAGTNTDEYTKLQNAVEAGSGAPDVAQIEYYAMPQFALNKSLFDLSAYGLDSLKSQYTASTWGSVDIDGKLYGLPQDSGPMAMFYNVKVFDKYKIEVPKTWDEYVAAGEKLHKANPKEWIAQDTGDPGFATSMIWQAGGHPLATNGTDVTINLADEGSKKWADSWNKLVEGNLLSDINGWTDEWYRALSDGTIATLINGAWMPGVLEASAKDGSGDWRVAPMPTYDGTPVSAENGGGAQAVMKQSKNPALAAAFLRWLNNDPASLKIFAESGGFPSTTAQLSDPAFVGKESEYFGGQKINEVLTQAAKEVPTGWSYLPYQVYANSVFNDTVGQAYVNHTDLNAGLKAWQDKLAAYGKAQGFTVKS